MSRCDLGQAMLYSYAYGDEVMIVVVPEKDAYGRPCAYTGSEVDFL
jgi:hypothetical protein